MVHRERRLWHLEQAGYLCDRYGRAVFILNSLYMESTSDASSPSFPDGNVSRRGDDLSTAGLVKDEIWTNSESFFPEALLSKLGIVILGSGVRKLQAKP